MYVYVCENNFLVFTQITALTITFMQNKVLDIIDCKSMQSYMNINFTYHLININILNIQ